MTVGRSSSPTHQTGAYAEQYAQAYLQAHGLQWIASNVHCAFGEIDVVMLHAHCVVFVEVKARHRSGFGSAVESVTRAKQRKLCQTAAWFLAEHSVWAAYDCRFDVVGVNLSAKPPQVEWIQGAFLCAE